MITCCGTPTKCTDTRATGQPSCLNTIIDKRCVPWAPNITRRRRRCQRCGRRATTSEVEAIFNSYDDLRTKGPPEIAVAVLRGLIAMGMPIDTRTLKILRTRERPTPGAFWPPFDAIEEA